MTHPQTTFLSRIPLLESARGSRQERCCKRRRGVQLLELVISLSTASILMTGVCGAIIIANRAVGVATSMQATSVLDTGGLDRLRAELAEAYPATARSATGVTLSVGDRTGDGVRETVQYRWNGANLPLERSMNAGGWRNVTAALNQFKMDWRTCDPQSISVAPLSLEPSNAFVFQSVTLADSGLFNDSSLSISVPQTYQTNDLLVAAIAIGKDQQGTVSMPAGWTKLLEQPYSNSVTLAVFHTFAGSGSSVTIGWTQHSERAYATLAHFRVGSASPALTVSATASGSAVLAAAPASTATLDNSLVLRFVAADLNNVPDDETNMPAHVAVTMRSQTLFEPAIGLAYRTSNAGAVSAASFTLKSQSDYATATVVFRP